MLSRVQLLTFYTERALLFRGVRVQHHRDKDTDNDDVNNLRV